MSDSKRRWDLRSWVSSREPPVPEAFLRLVHPGSSSEAEPSAEALLAEAGSALRDALSGTGERRGAFRLLAADAYLTYACELVVASEDPARALERVALGVVEEAVEG